MVDNTRLRDGENSDAWSGLSAEDFYADSECDLRRDLDAIQSLGTFASCSRCASLDPEVYVHDVGAITLPCPWTSHKRDN